MTDEPDKPPSYFAAPANPIGGVSEERLQRLISLYEKADDDSPFNYEGHTAKALRELLAARASLAKALKVLEIERIERQRAEAGRDHLASILGSIISVVPPNFVKSDGTVMQFVPPDPLRYLRALANAISKACAVLPGAQHGEKT